MSDSALPTLLDSPSPLIRVRRLFEFLTRAQELRAPRVRDVSSYEYVLWLGSLPDHESVSYLSDKSQLDPEVVTLARVQRSPAPTAPRDVAPWLVQLSTNRTRPLHWPRPDPPEPMGRHRLAITIPRRYGSPTTPTSRRTFGPGCQSGSAGRSANEMSSSCRRSTRSSLTPTSKPAVSQMSTSW